jgi:hypothetical protein
VLERQPGDDFPADSLAILHPMLARLSPFFPALLVFVGALFVAAGGFWASWRQSNFNIDIRAKNEEISRLQQENLNQLTSSDSFCHIEATGNPDNSVLLTLFHNGKYPLFDVFVEIQDTAAARRFWERFKQSGQTQLGSADISAAKGVVLTQNIGTLNEHAALPLISVPAASPTEPRTFTILMRARNGFYTETINIVKQKDGGRWLVEAHLFKLGTPNNDQIWERVSPDFPRDQ